MGSLWFKKEDWVLATIILVVTIASISIFYAIYGRSVYEESSFTFHIIIGFIFYTLLAWGTVNLLSRKNKTDRVINLSIGTMAAGITGVGALFLTIEGNFVIIDTINALK